MHNVIILVTAVPNIYALNLPDCKHSGRPEYPRTKAKYIFGVVVFGKKVIKILISLVDYSSKI